MSPVEAQFQKIWAALKEDMRAIKQLIADVKELGGRVLSLDERLAKLEAGKSGPPAAEVEEVETDEPEGESNWDALDAKVALREELQDQQQR